MMKNIFIKASFFMAMALVVAGVVSCDEDYAEKLTGTPPTNNSVDVSSRISGLSASQTGAGAALAVNGSDLSGVIAVRIGNAAGTDLVVEAGSVSFTVSTDVELGMQNVTLVWAGSERATSSIEVIPLPAIVSMVPGAASAGETVTLVGAYMDAIASLDVNGTAVTTISVQEEGIMRFAMPAGATTGSINALSTIGTTSTTSFELTACETDAINLACLPAINTNGSFEDSDVGILTGSPTGWGGLVGSLITSEITDEEYYQGDKSVKITINGAIGANPWSIQPNSTMQVVPGELYNLSVWVKGSGMANLKFAIDQGGNPGWAEYGNPEVEVNSTQWTEISYEFTPETTNSDPGNARYALSMSYAGNETGVLYMDNLRIVKVE